MATIGGDNSSISTNAYSLLDCFVDGLDNVIYEMAEEIAKDRIAKTGADPSLGTINIDIDDVKAAAEKVTEALKERLTDTPGAEQVIEAIDSMNSCLKSRSKENRT